MTDTAAIDMEYSEPAPEFDTIPQVFEYHLSIADITGKELKMYLHTNNELECVDVYEQMVSHPRMRKAETIKNLEDSDYKHTARCIVEPSNRENNKLKVST